MAGEPGNPIMVDGSIDFGGGVNSIKVSTVASQTNPNGLQRNELSWMVNCTVRDGGITQRTGWQPVGVISDGSELFQDASFYDPATAFPYILASIGGKILQVDPNGTFAPVDLSAAFGLPNPPTVPHAFMQQAEQFMVIQAGDGVTLPLFWDGSLLRRSVGIGGAPTSELPAATAMDYYMGRLWYAQGRVYSAGDIVGNTASGTLPYNFTDSVLKVTENPLAVGGDGFTVPSQAGNIRALKHSANLDAALGQGTLFIGTRKSIYALTVPVSRTAWIAADANNQPLQTVVQINNGMVGDRSVVAINGDLFYQTLEPAIQSLISAVRYFQQWGNTPVSANEDRILAFNDRALLHDSSGISFDNRVIQTALPKSLPQGTVHMALLPLDFTPLSVFNKALPPAWEGHYEGLQVLKLLTADFGGRERAFAIVVSEKDSSIQLWELTDFARTENGDNRVTWQFETPAWTWGQELELKKMVSAEFWVDKLFGNVDFTLEYREDSNVCYRPWHKWRACSARNSCEDVHNPVCYPLEPRRESFRSTMTLPLPPNACDAVTGRPANVGYQFQLRLTVQGWCRIRGVRVFAEPVLRQLYTGKVC